MGQEVFDTDWLEHAEYDSECPRVRKFLVSEIWSSTKTESKTVLYRSLGSREDDAKLIPPENKTKPTKLLKAESFQCLLAYL